MLKGKKGKQNKNNVEKETTEKMMSSDDDSDDEPHMPIFTPEIAALKEKELKKAKKDDMGDE